MAQGSVAPAWDTSGRPGSVTKSPADPRDAASLAALAFPSGARRATTSGVEEGSSMGRASSTNVAMLWPVLTVMG